MEEEGRSRSERERTRDGQKKAGRDRTREDRSDKKRINRLGPQATQSKRRNG